MHAGEFSDGDGIITKAFGAENRNRLIEKYFAERGGAVVEPYNAWEHIYRLLLWPDRTTGLAHCYESDKCQPGRKWYSRSLAFHDWLSSTWDLTPTVLPQHIDWLFLKAAAELATETARAAPRLQAIADRQKQPYDGREFPKAGEDRELLAIFQRVLGPYLGRQPDAGIWQDLIRRVQQHFALENKRKNLVGEGFEDVLSHVIRRAVPEADVYVRHILQKIPGFERARQGDKPNKVDLAVIRPRMRTLVTAKWSVRADREKQFESEYAEYISAESTNRSFEYVFVTNEFDPARLMRACNKIISNNHMFKHVVHINTAALRATYGASPEASMRQVVQLIDEGRLISLEHWLHTLRA